VAEPAAEPNFKGLLAVLVAVLVTRAHLAEQEQLGKALQVVLGKAIQVLALAAAAAQAKLVLTVLTPMEAATAVLGQLRQSLVRW
jgi:hypothetical protein